MEIKINGEPLRQLHVSICDSKLNATDISERMCDISNAQIDFTLQGFELLKDHIMTVVGLF